MASNLPAKCCTVGVRHEGTPTGQLIKIADGTIEAYVAQAPADKAHAGTGLILIPDIWGIYPNAQLIADQLAANGYTTIIPDVFDGDKFTPGQDVVHWILNGTDDKKPHTPAQVDPIIVAGIKALKEQYGATKIGALGYCFGAKYAVRNFKSGVDVAYVAHPSFVEADELAAVTGPVSIAAAQTDGIFPPEKRAESEKILVETKLPFQINLYSGVEHGFAVRGDVTNKAQKFAKEAAFFQAVSWFDTWLV